MHLESEESLRRHGPDAGEEFTNSKSELGRDGYFVRPYSNPAGCILLLILTKGRTFFVKTLPEKKGLFLGVTSEP